MKQILSLGAWITQNCQRTFVTIKDLHQKAVADGFEISIQDFQQALLLLEGIQQVSLQAHNSPRRIQGEDRTYAIDMTAWDEERGLMGRGLLWYVVARG